jgi:hypothetical protein
MTHTFKQNQADGTDFVKEELVHKTLQCDRKNHNLIISFTLICSIPLWSYITSIVNISQSQQITYCYFYLKVLATSFGLTAIIRTSKDNLKIFNTVLLCYWDPMHYKILYVPIKIHRNRCI